MVTEVSPAPLTEILTLRDLYRQEMNCQIVHDSLHERGYTDTYLIRVDDRIAGYGCVTNERLKPKGVIKEFYLLPIHRASAVALFRQLAEVSQAKRVEAQTNDVLLTLMLYDCARRIESKAVLFQDAFTSNLSLPDVTFRKITEPDNGRIFRHTREPVGDWVIETEGEVAATGGIYFHYNPPYGDIFMEVAEPFRRRGYGSYLVQELKRTCYAMGKVPAARCQASNLASRATLQKAGLLPCARILCGVISF